MTTNKFPVKFGNTKLSKSIMIFNMGGHYNCPSRKLGLCKVCKDCYAKNPELRWPGVLKYRKQQHKAWMKNNFFVLTAILRDEIKKRKKHSVKYFRFNEAGDFYDATDIWKLDMIATALKKLFGIVTYGYTARSDLADEFVKYNSFIVRGSGFELRHGMTTVIEHDEKIPKGFHLCPKTKRNSPVVCGEDCCLCMSSKRMNIAFYKH